MSADFIHIPDGLSDVDAVPDDGKTYDIGDVIGNEVDQFDLCGSIFKLVSARDSTADVPEDGLQKKECVYECEGYKFVFWAVHDGEWIFAGGGLALT